MENEAMGPFLILFFLKRRTFREQPPHVGRLLPVGLDGLLHFPGQGTGWTETGDQKGPRAGPWLGKHLNSGLSHRKVTAFLLSYAGIFISVSLLDS